LNSSLRLRDGNFLVRSDHSSIRSSGDTTVASESGTIYLDAMDGNLITYSNELSHKIKIEDFSGNTWHNEAFSAYTSGYNHPTNGYRSAVSTVHNPLNGHEVLRSDHGLNSNNIENRSLYIGICGDDFISGHIEYGSFGTERDERHFYGSNGCDLIGTTLEETTYYGFDGNSLIGSDILGTKFHNIPESTADIKGLYGMDADGYLHSISIANLKTLLSA
jgi:hypothetical protein